ncbi:hypothetical protein TIFTF001_000660, partial [Ficus carica]
CFC